MYVGIGMYVAGCFDAHSHLYIFLSLSLSLFCISSTPSMVGLDL